MTLTYQDYITLANKMGDIDDRGGGTFFLESLSLPKYITTKTAISGWKCCILEHPTWEASYSSIKGNSTDKGHGVLNAMVIKKDSIFQNIIKQLMIYVSIIF